MFSLSMDKGNILARTMASLTLYFNFMSFDLKEVIFNQQAYMDQEFIGKLDLARMGYCCHDLVDGVLHSHRMSGFHLEEVGTTVATGGEVIAHHRLEKKYAEGLWIVVDYDIRAKVVDGRWEVVITGSFDESKVYDAIKCGGCSDKVEFPLDWLEDKALFKENPFLRMLKLADDSPSWDDLKYKDGVLDDDDEYGDLLTLFVKLAKDDKQA